MDKPWERRRRNFELFASTVVVDEVRKGEAKLATERLQFLREVELLDVTGEARRLGSELVRVAKIPAKAEIDALHIAVALTSRTQPHSRESTRSAGVMVTSRRLFARLRSSWRSSHGERPYR